MICEAFRNLHVPGCNEHYVLHNLRKSDDSIPALDFAAEKEGQVGGQISYARGTIRCKQGAERAVLSFGPVSVLPAYQKRGIGSALIVHAIGLARAMCYPVICIYGDPRYYSRSSCRCGERYEIRTADDGFAVALQVLELKRDVLNDMHGRFIESPAFAIDETGFAQYDATFPPKEKKETESQRQFRLLASLRY